MKIFLFILAIILITALATFIYNKLFSSLEPKPIIKNALKLFILINSIDFFILYNLFDLKSVLNPLRHGYTYSLYYFLIGIVILAGTILIKGIFSYFFKKEEREIKSRARSLVFYIFGLLFLFIGILAIASTHWEQSVYFDAYPDQIFITMLTPMTGADSKLTMSYIEGPLLTAITLTNILGLLLYSAIFYSYTLNDKRLIGGEVMGRRIAFYFGLLFFLFGLSYLYIGMDLHKITLGYIKEDSYIEEMYVNPANAKIKDKGGRRNLIHIYLESMENSFFDKANGGFMEENLMPNLLSLYDEGVNFSNLDGLPGGPLKTYGGSFSCASMVNQFFGLPMKIPAVFNQYAAKNKFLPGAVGLGDILKHLGYNQTILMCSTSVFGGLNHMYNDHGDFKIMDYDYIKEHNMLPDGYRFNWGFEDRKLYEFSKEEILRLAAQPEPFHIIVENADTHNPGLSFDSTGNPIFSDTNIAPDYGKTVSYSDKAVYDFVKWIQAQDFYKDTTVVIIGDHNSMEGSLFKGKDLSNYTRTTYNLILNPYDEDNLDMSRLSGRSWANFDYFPTILSAMGYEIEGNRLGLGTNLFSNLDTLYERDGYKAVNKHLVNKSSFYNELYKNKVNYNGINLI